MMKKKKYRIIAYDPNTMMPYRGYKEYFGKHELRQGLSNHCNDRQNLFMVVCLD